MGGVSEQNVGYFVLKSLKMWEVRTKEGWFCSKEGLWEGYQNKRGVVLF